MPTFAYQARDKAGQRVSGTREATDQRAALEALREVGLYVTQLAPVGRAFRAKSPPAPSVMPPQVMEQPGPLAPGMQLEAPLEQATMPETRAREAARESARQERTGTGQRMAPGTHRSARAGDAPEPALTQPWARANAKEMALFFRQMNSMLNAGTGLSQALHTMGSCAANPALRRACLEMSVQVAQGQPWSEVMRAYPGIFSQLAIGMISAGEMGGFLDRMCLRLSEYAERDYELQQTIKRETWYPKLLVFCSILIPSAVPFVVTAIQKTGNPFIAWIHSVIGPLLFVGIVWGSWKAFNYLAPVTLHKGSPRYIIDQIKLTLPIAGKTVRALSTAKFCRALSALYSAGMGLNRTLNLAADTTGNVVLSENVRRIIPRVESGENLSDCLESTGYFAPVVLQMLRTGEMSGSIDTQLEKVADFLEADAETTVKQSVKVLGIAVFLLIAMYIGMQVVQFWSGYINTLDDYNKM